MDDIIANTTSKNKNSTNSTHFDENHPGGIVNFTCLDIVVIAVYIISLVITITGNIIVLIKYIIRRKRTRSHNLIRNHLAFSLIIADAIWAIGFIPLQLADMGLWQAGSFRITCYMKATISLTMPDVLILTVCMISYERYYIVLKPFKLERLASRRPLLILTSWLLPIITNIDGVFFYKYYDSPGENGGSGQCRLDSDKSADLIMTFVTYHTLKSAIVLIFLPLIFMALCYYKIIRRCKKLQQIRNDLTQLRSIICIAFSSNLVTIVCWAPACTLQVVALFCSHSSLQRLIVPFQALTALNPAFNTILYSTVIIRQLQETNNDDIFVAKLRRVRVLLTERLGSNPFSSAASPSISVNRQCTPIPRQAHCGSSLTVTATNNNASCSTSKTQTTQCGVDSQRSCLWKSETHLYNPITYV